MCPAILDVVAEEINELGGGIDFGLPHGLALAQHRRGQDVVPVLGADQVGGLEEDGSAEGGLANDFTDHHNSPRTDLQRTHAPNRAGP